MKRQKFFSLLLITLAALTFYPQSFLKTQILKTDTSFDVHLLVLESHWNICEKISCEESDTLEEYMRKRILFFSHAGSFAFNETKALIETASTLLSAPFKYPLFHFLNKESFFSLRI